MIQVKCKMHYDSYILYFLSLTFMYVPSLILISGTFQDMVQTDIHYEK